MTFGCFSDLLVTQKTRGSTRLEKIDNLVDWSGIALKLDAILARSGMGPSGYDPLVLFKSLILSNLYGLSDPMLEEMLYDRLSFRRFCGLSVSARIPDETTICRFRNALSGQADQLFDSVMTGLAKKGITLKTGVIIDATVIQSAAKDPCGGTVSTTDPQAGWTKKGGRYHHGYKAHVSCDTQGLIKDVRVTGAEVHDSNIMGQLLDGSETEVHADKAYGSEKNRNFLKERGIKDCLMYKKTAKKGKQPDWQIQLNKVWSRTRNGVERIFAHWKGPMGLKRCRYIGEKKFQNHMELLALTYNLMRATKMVPIKP